MNIFLGVLLGIFVMTLVVTIHEFGHFIIAKRNGVRVKEFGIGFPPKAKAWLHIPIKEVERYCQEFSFSAKKTAQFLERAKKRHKDQFIWIPLPKNYWYKKTDAGLELAEYPYLIFSLNFLPIGGFCQMDGETNVDTRKGTFGAASLWSKTKILFAGVIMNWLLAFVILTILAWTGLPELFKNQYRIESDTFYTETSSVVVNEVFENTPAKASGLEKFDQILEISSNTETKKIQSSKDLQEFNQRHLGETVTYKILKPGQSDPIQHEIKLNTADSKYTLGISMSEQGSTKYRTTWSAPIVALVNTVQLTGETYRGIGQLVGDALSGFFNQFSSDPEVKAVAKAKLEAAGDSVSGPVGIIGVLFPAIAQTGLTNILLLAAIISISLACMNVLPIPALDGGRWLLIALFRFLKRPLTPETESKIVSGAFMALLVLAALITILDVTKILR